MRSRLSCVNESYLEWLTFPHDKSNGNIEDHQLLRTVLHNVEGTLTGFQMLQMSVNECVRTCERYQIDKAPKLVLICHPNVTLYEGVPSEMNLFLDLLGFGCHQSTSTISLPANKMSNNTANQQKPIPTFHEALEPIQQDEVGASFIDEAYLDSLTIADMEFLNPHTSACPASSAGESKDLSTIWKSITKDDPFAPWRGVEIPFLFHSPWPEE